MRRSTTRNPHTKKRKLIGKKEKATKTKKAKPTDEDAEAEDEDYIEEDEQEVEPTNEDPTLLCTPWSTQKPPNRRSCALQSKFCSRLAARTTSPPTTFSCRMRQKLISSSTKQSTTTSARSTLRRPTHCTILLGSG